MLIRSAVDADRDALWEILEPVLRAGETYTLPADIGRDAALGFWLGPAHEVFVLEDERTVRATYFLRANQAGGGSHVANCGYVTHVASAGRGYARALCAHSLERARERGFLAMQFNFVVSTNERAVRLWTDMGFDVVGRLPGAFRHPRLGFVDALVMFRSL